ncbi:uncharacterized protein LOC141854411 [Brevipalpus obovatus]|uniref:uncharacterized protein LOC141854411 n=1 Tax=Brevipalpus obovatus TaxID=246614 RepID=UPI003D9FAE81
MSMSPCIDETHSNLGEEEDDDQFDGPSIDESVSILEDHNPSIPAVSSKISIKRDHKGLGLYVANHDIEFGDVVLEEKPFAHTLFTNYCQDYCRYCLKRLRKKVTTSISCPECHAVMYCDQNCQQSDYHQIICRAGLGSLQDPTAKLVCEILARAIKETSLARYIDKDRADHVREWYSDYLSICRLSSSPQVSPETVQLSKEIAAKLKDSCSPLNENDIIELIQLHFQQMEVNKVFLKESSYELDMKSMDEEVESIGLAIYPTLSLINHSCKPNVFLFFYGKKAIIRSSRKIENGGEIFICYGPSFSKDSYKDRQSELRNFYHFDCECECCKDKLESPQIGYKCFDCKGSMIVNKCDSTGNCLSCKTISENLGKRIDDVEQAASNIPIGRRVFEEFNLDEAVQILSKNYNILDDNLYRTNRILLQSRQYLYECLAMMGHFEMAHKLCKMNVNATRDIFGEESVDYLVQMISFLSLKCNYIEDISDEDLTTAQKEAEELENLINEELHRLKRLSGYVDQALNQNANDVNDDETEGGFQKEVNTLLSLKRRCWALSNLDDGRNDPKAED